MTFYAWLIHGASAESDHGQCDYLTNIAARIIRAEVNRILQFDGDARAVLILRV
jgi:hypothetical protein